MNPLVTQQIRQIKQLAAELNDSVLDLRERLKDRQDAYVKLTQEYWSRGSHMAVLDRNEADYEALRNENERLHKRNDELRERLERVLQRTKAIRGAFHS